jgi:spore coat polysaccharide biosynthesis predicted glycosyltransferase SpsG
MIGKKTILHITAGSNRFGYGHIRRSMELSRSLTRFFNVLFYIYFEGNNTEFAVPAQGALISEPFKDEECDLILLDMPEEYAEAAVEHYKKAMTDIPMVALGYYSSIQGKPDVVINLDNNGRNVCRQSNYYTGLEYSIIRESFVACRKIKKGNKGFTNVVISFGGADIKGLSELLIRSFERTLNTYKNIRYHLVLGPLSKQDTYRPDLIDLKTYYAPSNLESIMNEADVAICNGGTMMIEYAYLGKPIIGIPQTDLEETFIRRFENNGAAILIKPEQITDRAFLELLGLINSNAKRETMSMAGKQMVDGFGTDRIIELIKKTI